MNRSSALHYMRCGRKVTHYNFTPDEWMTINPENGKLLFEDGCQCTIEQFMFDRNLPSWEDGYSLYESKSELNEIKDLADELISESEKKHLNLLGNDPYIFSNHYAGLMDDYNDIKYSHLTNKEKGYNIKPVRTTPKIGRNELCPCGSGKKSKHCTCK